MLVLIRVVWVRLLPKLESKFSGGSGVVKGWLCSLAIQFFPVLCRMENREDCKKVIEVLDKAKLAGNSENITVKFADSGSSRRKLSELIAHAWMSYAIIIIFSKIGGRISRR